MKNTDKKKKILFKNTIMLYILTFSSYYAFYENLPAISISPDTKLGEGEARERYEIDGLSDMITKRGE